MSSVLVDGGMSKGVGREPATVDTQMHLCLVLCQRALSGHRNPANIQDPLRYR